MRIHVVMQPQEGVTEDLGLNASPAERKHTRLTLLLCRYNNSFEEAHVVSCAVIIFQLRVVLQEKTAFSLGQLCAVSL